MTHLVSNGYIMQQFNVRFDSEQAEKITGIAKQMRNSEAGVIRLAIDQLLHAMEKRPLVIPPPRARLTRPRRNGMA